ncbi:MAG: SIR2 family NAD-dependent protein deacylase, partial [Candidatus Saccharimonadales bacterium]
TTNYDHLFEMASDAAGQPAQVLPYAPAARNKRWLLKLHGSVDHPGDIVLSREDYLRYADRRAALAGIVQALLITRQMLFVGFSLTDENFHRIADDVRKAIRGPEQPMTLPQEFGTALFLEKDALLEELWRHDLCCVGMADELPASLPAEARRLEIFLDYVLAEASQYVSPLLNAAYQGILSQEERDIRDLLRQLEQEASEDVRKAPAWRRIAALLDEFRGTSDMMSYSHDSSRSRGVTG